MNEGMGVCVCVCIYMCVLVVRLGGLFIFIIK